MTVSCVRQANIDRIKIANYSIGDRIDKKDIEFEFQVDSVALIGKSVSDKRLTLLIWNDTIVSLFYSQLTKAESDSISQMISKKLKLQPEVRTGISREGIRMLGQEYYWFDSLSEDEITLGYNHINADSIRSAILIINQRFSYMLLPKGKNKIEIAE